MLGEPSQRAQVNSLYTTESMARVSKGKCEDAGTIARLMPWRRLALGCERGNASALDAKPHGSTLKQFQRRRDPGNTGLGSGLLLVSKCLQFAFFWMPELVAARLRHGDLVGQARS